MFDFLKKTTAGQTVNAAYHAIRMLGYRKSLDDLQNSFQTKMLSSDTSPRERALALQIISEIQEKEKKPLEQLSKKEADDYIKALSRVVRKKMYEKYPSDRQEGRRLLRELEAAAPPLLSRD